LSLDFDIAALVTWVLQYAAHT